MKYFQNQMFIYIFKGDEKMVGVKKEIRQLVEIWVNGECVGYKKNKTIVTDRLGRSRCLDGTPVVKVGKNWRYYAK